MSTQNAVLGQDTRDQRLCVATPRLVRAGPQVAPLNTFVPPYQVELRHSVWSAQDMDVMPPPSGGVVCHVTPSNMSVSPSALTTVLPPAAQKVADTHDTDSVLAPTGPGADQATPSYRPSPATGWAAAQNVVVGQLTDTAEPPGAFMLTGADQEVPL